MVASSMIGLATTLLAIVASTWFLLTMLRYRGNPTTLPMVGLSLTLLLGSLLHLIVVDLEFVREAVGLLWGPTDVVGGLWMLIAFDVPAVVAACWFLFALQYTGRERVTSPIIYASVGLLLFFLIGSSVSLAAVGAVLGIPATVLNTVLGGTILLTEGLALIGIFLILSSTLRHKAFSASQMAGLVGAVGVVLVVPFVATTLQRPIATPIAIASSALLFTGTVHRYPVFRSLPVAYTVGRDHVVDEMTEGILVVDGAGRVRDVNARGAVILGREKSGLVDEQMSAVAPALPQPERVPESEAVERQTESGRILSITADSVTDDRARERGHLLVYQDVTDERRREHRLGLLTTLVAGAAKSQMAAVRNLAGRIQSGNEPPEPSANQIHHIATSTAKLVARIREVERLLAETNATTAETTTIETLVRDLRLPPDVRVVGCSPAESRAVRVETDLLAATLEMLVEGAITTSGEVDVRVTDHGDEVGVEIVPFERPDDGGFPALTRELASLVTEQAEWRVRETPHDDAAMKLTLLIPRALGGKERREPGGESTGQ